MTNEPACMLACLHAQDTKAVAGGGIVVSINGVDVQFGGASGTAQFASRVPNAAGRGLQVRLLCRNGLGGGVGVQGLCEKKLAWSHAL